MKRFPEIVEIFFDELEEKGTTDEVLATLGWKKRHQSWMPPLMVANEMSKLDDER